MMGNTATPVSMAGPRGTNAITGRPSEWKPTVAPTFSSPIGRESDRNPKLVLLTSTKGGCGKTTTALNLAAVAVNEGYRVGTIDFDLQRALTGWVERRPEEAPAIIHLAADLRNFEATLHDPKLAELDVVFIDMPPGVESVGPEIRNLIRAVDLALVPSNQGGVDPDTAVQWLTFLHREGIHAAAILNRARANSRSFHVSRVKLQDAGLLCPFDVRDLEDIREAIGLGLGVVELARATGADDYRGVWSFVKNHARLNLVAAEA